MWPSPQRGCILFSGKLDTSFFFFFLWADTPTEDSASGGLLRVGEQRRRLRRRAWGSLPRITHWPLSLALSQGRGAPAASVVTSSTRQRAGRERLPAKQRMHDGAWVWRQVCDGEDHSLHQPPEFWCAGILLISFTPSILQLSTGAL